MNKILITHSPTLAATIGAFAKSSRHDAYNVPSFDGYVAPTNDLDRYGRADNDGLVGISA